MLLSSLNVKMRPFLHQFWKLLFLSNVIIIFPANSSSNPAELLLISELGETYRTNTSTCPVGSYFYRDAHPVDCICSKGLWVFYEQACGNPTFLHGTEERACVMIDFPVKKVLLISEDLEPSLSILHPKDGIMMKLFQNSINHPFQMVDAELVVASGEWSLELRNGKTVCMGTDNSFCIYESEALGGETVDYVVKGCRAHPSDTSPAIRLKHLRCTEFLRGSTNQTRRCNHGSRSKREYKNYQVQGRSFIPTSLAMNPDFNSSYWNNETKWNQSIPPEDEDYYNVTRDGDVLIKSQIWNYFTERATEILELYDFERVKPQKRIAAFQFLDIAKEIFNIRCPTHYVPKAHLDMSVGAFRAIQLRDFLYNEPPVTHEEVDRIMRVLKKCKNGTNGSFPFTWVNRTCNESNPDPAGMIATENPLNTTGQFHMFDQENMLDVPFFMSPMQREPIIDTVWNIYMHTHSHCFEYFNNSAFNDHHRFSTIMMSLFSNGIQDLWLQERNITSDIYGGLLGDVVVLMQRVVHCAATSRIENGTTYPWDLKRLNDTGTTTQNLNASGRRKRQAPRYEGNEFQAHMGCLQNLDDNSYVCQD